LVKQRVARPTLAAGAALRSSVVLKIRYAGFCGSDRGIWHRKAFGDMIGTSLDAEHRDVRVTGHELLGEIVEVGPRAAAKYGYRVGDVVSCESHIVCGTCWQCRHGQEHVCLNEKILGISLDGCFAEYLQVPAKALWPTDLSRIRPEVAAIQEPFGNAVHACQVTDLRGKTVAVFGTGTIGLFAVLVARGMGASQVIGIEPDARHRDMALRLGCDAVLTPGAADAERPYLADPSIVAQLHDATKGLGVDVAMEMSGAPQSLNTAIQSARRGGDVVLFGVRNGDMVLQDAHRIIMNGLQLHGVVGRRIFATWNLTKALLENTDNGIQDAIWRVILNQGDGPIVPMSTWTPETFEETMALWPKPVIAF